MAAHRRQRQQRRRRYCNVNAMRNALGHLCVATADQTYGGRHVYSGDCVCVYGVCDVEESKCPVCRTRRMLAGSFTRFAFRRGRRTQVHTHTKHLLVYTLRIKHTQVSLNVMLLCICICCIPRRRRSSGVKRVFVVETGCRVILRVCLCVHTVRDWVQVFNGELLGQAKKEENEK